MNFCPEGSGVGCGGWDGPLEMRLLAELCLEVRSVGLSDKERGTGPVGVVWQGHRGGIS